MIDEHLNRLRAMDQELRAVKDLNLSHLSSRALALYNEFRTSVFALDIFDIGIVERVIEFYERKVDRMYRGPNEKR